MHQRDPEREIDYYNCGAWIEAHLTYITVGEDGVLIHEFKEYPDHRHAAMEYSDSEVDEFAGDELLLEDGAYEEGIRR